MVKRDTNENVLLSQSQRKKLKAEKRAEAQQAPTGEDEVEDESAGEEEVRLTPLTMMLMYMILERKIGACSVDCCNSLSQQQL